MGFLSGRVSYVRYRVVGGELPAFDEELLETVRRHLIGRHGADEAADGVSYGWAGGDHVLDTTIEAEKNLFDDVLHLAMRLDTDKIPGSLLRAYTKIEIDARARMNPSGFATKSQKQEAKEAALVRAEAEAADGRFKRLTFSPVLWDRRDNVVYAGASSSSVLERLMTLFRETFGLELEPITAGSLAQTQAEARGDLRSVEEFGPIGFVDEAGASVAWTESDSASRDYWGNEFLLWLWHTLQIDGDTIALSDGTECTLMLAKTLTLDCPRGLHGRDQLTTEGPTKLPEAFRALQAGKLPRKAGLIVVRHDQQYELTLSAESLAVSGLALPKLETDGKEGARTARIEGLRHLVETLDLLYDAYGRKRISPEWTGELGRIRQWLSQAA
ncbi:MAG: hypothetical protein SFX72_01510 [Isosphaeraceae bacterium]|nr:hypothetical protein [Isosphaeraceae bacterium]